MKLRTPRPYFLLITYVIILILSVQCGNDGSVGPDTDPIPQSSVSKTIDENGGEVALGDEAWVIIPAGALDSAQVITITRLAEPLNPPANYASKGNAYSFTPHSYPFNLPVTICVTYDENAADPSMVRLDDEADTSWESIGNAACAAGTATCGSSTFSILSVTSFQALEEVYVSTDSKGPDAAGTKEDPLPGINIGIQTSIAAGAPCPPVMVAVGAYNELLEFGDGVSVHGGLDGETWEESSESNTIVALGPNYARASGITEVTMIEGLVMVASNATMTSTSSVALHVLNCGDGLRFENCRFIAGKGGDGSPGGNGSIGGNGGRGADAGSNESVHWRGGAGGSGPYQGGKGGNGCWAIPGIPGTAGGGFACGGLGGSGAIPPSVAFVGANGGWGSNGANGAKGTNDGTGETDGWSPEYAGNGNNGAAGCGGGGGGGGSHLFNVNNAMGGGGGGGGAYGGGRATGARGGGSSFAVYLWESSPVFVSCEFFPGEGGQGGKGGNGGARGLGGGYGVSYGGSWSDKGARGGYGGHGGLGGSGGGGAGGHSFCVYRFGDACLNADFSACNSWDFHPGQAGHGGAGGKASDDISEGVQAPRGDEGLTGIIGPE
jgi:hypothetical protein